MEFKIYNKKETEDYLAYLFEKYEDEFVDNFGDYEKTATKYLDGETRKSMVPIVNGEKSGIVVFDTEEEREEVASFCPCIYVNFGLIEKNNRRNGIMTEMFKNIFKNYLRKKEYPNHMCHRTWIKKKKVRQFSKKLGFNRITLYEDNGNMRVYYCKSV